MIKDFVGRIKATKKLADEKNIRNWYNCLLQGIIVIFAISLYLSLYTISFFKDVWETPVGELPFYAVLLPIVYSVILSYLALEKLIILNILILEKLSKIVFTNWQKFDMWYFRKYRKDSPITSFLAKIQLKFMNSKMSKRKRRLIMLSLIAGLILLNFSVRIPMLLDSAEEQTEINTENDLTENEPGEENEIRIRVNGG